MKIQMGFIVLSLVMFSPLAKADCQSTKQDATDSCKKVQEFATTSKADFDYVNGLLQDKGAGKNASTALANLEGKQKTIAELITQCSSARKNCSEFCGADATSGDPTKMTPGQEGKNYCENGQPKQNEDAGKKGQGDMSQAIGALAQLLAALGQKPPTTASTDKDCVQDPSQTKCKTDVAAKADGTFADGTARTSTAGSSLDSSGLSGSAGVAAGTPAAVTLSSAMPGGAAGGGSGMGAGAGGGSSGKEGGKKAEEDGPKLNLASTPGGGGGGGGGGNGGGGHSGIGSGATATRTAVDGDTRLQAAIEKAAQQRGLASDGPPGGITSSLSMDNFQKIEKRMQSERNQLNEF